MRVSTVSVRGRRYFSAGALLLIAAGACRTMQPVPVAFITETRPPVIYLADGFGVVTMVTNPRVSGDTVLGTTPGGAGPVAVPLREVQRVNAVRVHRGRTALLVGALAAAGAFTAYAVLSPAAGRSTFTCDYNKPTYDGAPQCGFPVE